MRGNLLRGATIDLAHRRRSRYPGKRGAVLHIFGMMSPLWNLGRPLLLHQSGALHPIDCARQSGIRTLNRRRVVDQIRKKEIEWNRNIGFKMVEQEVEDGINEFG